MTGYGRHKEIFEKYTISVELKSVNSRFLEIHSKLPQNLSYMELALKKEIKSSLHRGNIYLYINIQPDSESKNLYQIDENIVKHYLDRMRNIGKKLNIDGEIDWNTLFNFNDIIVAEEAENDEEALLADVLKTLKISLINLSKHRKAEGEQIEKVLFDFINRLAVIVDEISLNSKEAAQIQFKKLKERLDTYFSKEGVDNNRLEQEFAIICDKVDISEEIDRIHSHINLFKENLKKVGPIGQKLNFICQELNREANTIASKTNLAEISHLAVELKNVIEKIREQVQNIE